MHQNDGNPIAARSYLQQPLSRPKSQSKVQEIFTTKKSYLFLHSEIYRLASWRNWVDFHEPDQSKEPDLTVAVVRFPGSRTLPSTLFLKLLKMDSDAGSDMLSRHFQVEFDDGTLPQVIILKLCQHRRGLKGMSWLPMAFPWRSWTSWGPNLTESSKIGPSTEGTRHHVPLDILFHNLRPCRLEGDEDLKINQKQLKNRSLVEIVGVKNSHITSSEPFARHSLCHISDWQCPGWSMRWRWKSFAPSLLALTISPSHQVLQTLFSGWKQDRSKVKSQGSGFAASCTWCRQVKPQPIRTNIVTQAPRMKTLGNRKQLSAFIFSLPRRRNWWGLEFRAFNVSIRCTQYIPFTA